MVVSELATAAAASGTAVNVLSQSFHNTLCVSVERQGLSLLSSGISLLFSLIYTNIHRYFSIIEYLVCNAN